MGCGTSKRAAVSDEVVSANKNKVRPDPMTSSLQKRKSLDGKVAQASPPSSASGSPQKQRKDEGQEKSKQATAASESDAQAPLSDSAVKVAVVIRPLLEAERQKNAKECVSLQGPSTVLLAPRVASAGPSPPDTEKGIFEMERAYIMDNAAVEQRMFSELVKPLLDRYLAGFNATVFAYGQTGAGKTHAMGTASSTAQMAGAQDPCGVIPRAVSYIFAHMPELRANYSVSLTMEYVEVYQDELRDLLRSAESATSPGLVIRESPSRGTYIENAEQRVVSSEAAVGMALEDGNARRATAAHNMNESSSRSHALFTLHLEQRLLPNASAGHRFLRSKLHLVDLAGSERAKETGSSGQTFAEGVQINKGLSALGNVISALTEGSGRKHIPYRDSKLTRLLQDSLGGNSETLMIACCAPAVSNREQTLNTLRYAARARNIRNRVRVNNRYNAEEEIAALRAALAEKEALVDKLRAELAAAQPLRSSRKR